MLVPVPCLLLFFVFIQNLFQIEKVFCKNKKANLKHLTKFSFNGIRQPSNTYIYRYFVNRIVIYTDGSFDVCGVQFRNTAST